jgi:glycosyltransferase involved in cell wall biosynthesis
MQPFFSVIITVYNHARFLTKVSKSLAAQSFKDFEVIFIDNASSDGSKDILQSIEIEGIKVTKIYNQHNLGICKAFNIASEIATGNFLIDLSPDDEFLPHKLLKNHQTLTETKAHLLFSDCLLVNEENGESRKHSALYPFDYKGIGNYFIPILERHCLASPTIVFSRHLFDSLGGYDETLSYEDFDFMLRASKNFDLVYDTDVLVKKHLVKSSFSTQFKKRNSPIHDSTLKVCRKMLSICQTQDEKNALKTRLWHESKAQLKLFNFGRFWKFWGLLSH